MSMKLSQVLSTLSDEDSFQILQKVVSNGGVKINKADYKTPRRYYSRLARLRKTSQIRKATKGKGFEPTLLGKILYDLLQTAEAACDLSWRLNVLDEIFRHQAVPEEEKEGLVRKLIPDPQIQRLLFQQEEAETDNVR